MTRERVGWWASISDFWRLGDWQDGVDLNRKGEIDKRSWFEIGHGVGTEALVGQGHGRGLT